MKVCLGMIVKDEEFFLQRNLPSIRTCLHDTGFIAIDAWSKDKTTDILEKFGAKVFRREWNGNYSDARNYCVDLATEQKYDWLFMLDADETLLPRVYVDLIEAMKEPNNEFLVFPRIEFFGDTNHFDPTHYPDLQGRAIRLGKGYHWKGGVHEVIFRNTDTISAWSSGIGTLVPTVQIFHYGWALQPERRFRKYYKTEPKKDFLDNPHLRIYTGVQPI